jgi:hypothetical protein
MMSIFRHGILALSDKKLLELTKMKKPDVKSGEYWNKKEKRTTGPFLVENIGVEPTTSCMPCKRSSQLS